MTTTDNVIAWAQMELGRPYAFGDSGPTAFDCSGLIKFIFDKVGITLPHKASEQQALAIPVTTPSPGDLVFFGQPAYHVGLYIGGGKMISAPHTGATVHITDVGSPTGYGRVPGLSSTATLVGQTLGAGSSQVFGLTSSLIGPIRDTVIEALFAVLGLALLGFGIFHAATATSKETAKELIT